MMGSGKSTIGRLLSEATGWPYIDNDELVRRSRGATARQILAERGEDRLRDAESDALMLGIETPPPAVVGVAAGTILDPANASRSTPMSDPFRMARQLRESTRAAPLPLWQTSRLPFAT